MVENWKKCLEIIALSEDAEMSISDAVKVGRPTVRFAAKALALGKRDIPMADLLRIEECVRDMAYKETI